VKKIDKFSGGGNVKFGSLTTSHLLGKETPMNAKEFLVGLQELAADNILRNTTYYLLIAQVDPDALGAAFGLKWFMTQIGFPKVKIYYAGGFSHPQNRAIVNRFDLANGMETIRNLNLTGDDRLESAILVDSSRVHDGRLQHLSGKIAPVIIVDHHRDSDVEARLMWIEDMGACSTLIVEILREASVDREQAALELTQINRVNPNIATLLRLGIYTDTKRLEAASKVDMEAYTWIVNFSIDARFNQMLEYPLPPSYFEQLKMALEKRDRRGSRLVTTLGFLPSDDADSLSTVADLLIREEGVDLVIVWGIVDKKIVRISARCTNLTLPLGEFLRARFGANAGAKLAPDGLSEGGATFEFSLGPLIVESNRESAISFVGTFIRTQALTY
jgi:nanoRNase/pAp phosphatase (c-di-AMP/oligoRNAs hydrolase)